VLGNGDRRSRMCTSETKVQAVCEDASKAMAWPGLDVSMRRRKKKLQQESALQTISVRELLNASHFFVVHNRSRRRKPTGVQDQLGLYHNQYGKSIASHSVITHKWFGS
jgi:hypothetical protein